MAESTLSLTWNSLLDEITEQVYGGDGDYDSIAAADQARVKRILAQGLRQFYNPPALRGYVHAWSFLFPTATLTINAPYATGTIAYDHTGGTDSDAIAQEYLVTLTTGTWPDWTDRAKIQIDNLDYSPAATYSTGTFTYVHTGGANERQVTITGTIPSWATGKRFRYNDTIYDINARIDDTILTLDGAGLGADVSTASLYEIIDINDTDLILHASDNPGADVTAGESYSLHEDDYRLPDDFGHILGPVHYTQGSQAITVCNIVDESRILQLRQRAGTTIASDEPWQAAIRARIRGETEGTVQEIMFWPPVSSASTAYIKYKRRPNAMTDANRLTGYPWGASDHSETILQSCLAAAEERLDEVQGPHWQRFMTLLESSIELDGRSNRPEFLGENRDDSDSLATFANLRHRVYGEDYGNPVLYVGTGS